MKSKETKNGLSKKASNKVIEQIPWREESLALSIQEYIERTCDVLLMVESEESCSDIIFSCYMGYKLKPIAPVKIITYTDLKMEIIEYANSNDPDKSGLFQEACAEAVEELEKKDTIHAELLAHLLKIKIMYTINEDVRMEQEQLFIQIAKENEYKQMFESPDAGGDGKKKKGKEKPAKDTKKADAGKKKKGAAPSENTSGITTTPAKAYSQFSKSTDHPELQVADKHLYIILTGFYNPELIGELVRVGVPLCCLLEVSFTQSALFKQDFSETISSASSSNYLEDVESVAAEEEENPAVPPSSVATLHSETKSSEPPLKLFWSKVIDLLHSENQYKYMENIFHMFYKLTEYIPPEINSEFEELCNDIFEKQFEDLSNFVMEIETLKRQYVNYTRSLKLQTIPCAPVVLPLRCLRIYNKLMNKFPPDCFSIALLMACLIEEVCSSVPEGPSEPDISLYQKESEENPLRLDNSESKPTVQHHEGIKDQVVNVLEGYKNRYDPAQGNKNNKQPFRCYTCKYDPKIDIRMDSKCFMVHASNDLQIVMNCYKRLSKELYAINMNGLKKSKAAVLRSRHACGIVLEKLMNEYNLQSWRKALGLSKDELCDAIHTFLLTQMQDAAERPSSETEINGTEQYPCVNNNMLSCRYKIEVESVPNTFDESDHVLAGQLSFGGLYRNFSKNVSQILSPGSLSEYCYKEYLPGPVLLQELLKAGLEYECVDQLYSPITDTLLLLLHNDLDEFGCASIFKTEFLRTPVCIRDFTEHMLLVEKDWIEDQEFLYQTEYRKEIEELKRKKEELRKALYSEFIPDEFYFILPDSIKAKLLAKDEPKPTQKDAGNKKGGKPDKQDKKKGSDSDKKKDASSKATSSKKSEAQLDIEDVLRKMPEQPEKRRLSLRCAEENEPYTFIAYDLGSSQVQMNVWTSVFHSLDGLKVVVDRTCWLGTTAIVSIKLVSNNHNFIFHYRPDLVTTEPIMFHSILSDGSCLAFSKPIKFQKVEEAICERICKSKANKLKTEEESSAYQPKRQEIYFVSEKQDCVVKSFKIPFSKERNLVLSENLLVPFLDSLEKFNIRARVTVPAETLRHRQERRHNLRNRISTSATVTKTSLSQYATVNKKKKSSTRVGMVEKYSPKVIVHKPSRPSMTQAGDDEFLQHSDDVQKISTIPSATEIKTKKEALQKLKEAIENHIPLFKICSSRLHKYTYVKRIKSYISIPIGSVMKRILYKPAYYKTKRAIDIKKCLPLGCVNVAKIKKPAYNIRISLPSGLVIRDIPGVASDFPCIRQYYIDKGPQCKDIVHEESRTFLRNGNIAIKRCDGNINVLNANGRIFHFEVPYIMKTRTEKTNYRDSNATKLQRSLNIPVHAAKRSLTTFQKLLHRVLPRRFKHMIDSKESRYYLSRRAYLKAQKKNCNNIDMLYLLESQRLPFPEYTVITPDGKKIKVSKSKVYEKHKFYVATDIDFRSEETLFEREDGTCCILNREGVLTTQFPDGTRLTTWFVESPNQVFADEIEDLHTKDAFMQTDFLSNLERSRIQMMDFDFGMDEGWVSVFMYYEYSHPNYATVVFGGEDSEMSVILPNGSRITSKEGQKTTVTVGKFLETEFDKRKFSLKTRGCENCANSARAVLELGPWYHGKLPKNRTDTFVHIKDSFEKVFRVDYDGRCSRNPTECTKAETDCNRHAVPTLEKLFSVKSDFSGCVYWNKPDFKTLMALAERNENFTVDTYNNGPDENAVVEFKEYICKPYHERYICKYDEPTLKLTKYKTKQGKVAANPAYILRKVLRKIVNIDKIEPLYKCVLENCEKYGLRKKYENFELFFKHVTQHLPEIQRGLKKEEDECLDPCPCVTTKKDKAKNQEREEMQRVQVLHDKWYTWQEECKKYKQLVKENYVPLYFKSKFGNEFCDENRKDDGDYIRPSEKSEEPEESCGNDEEIEMEMVRQSSFDVIRPKSKEIDVEKQKTAEKQIGKKIVKEHLRIKIPKDMVLLYNQGKGDKSLEIAENAITARSESKGQESEYRPEKMLVLAGVRDASKVEIASRFLEMQGAAKKYKEGSKVVIIAEETQQAPTLQPQENKHSEEIKVSSNHPSREEAIGTTDPDFEVNASCKNDSFGVNISDSIEGESKSLSVIEFVDDDEQPPQMTVYVEEESESLHDEEGPPHQEFLPALIDDATKADITAHRSATDVLKDVVMISRDLLEVTSDEQSVSVDDPDDAYPAYTKKRVMSVLSSLMKMVIAALSECPEDIPAKISKSITASAYRLISSANMNKSEMKLFLKTLDDLVENAFSHVEPRGSVSSSESSDIELMDKSKLIPVKNIGDVLNSYSRGKPCLKSSGSSNVKSHTSFVHTLDQKASKGVGGFEEGNVDSEITISYKDMDISGSLIGFTSKFNFQRYSDSSQKVCSTVTKDRDQTEHARSSADFVYHPKRRKSSISASRVKFQKDNKDTHKSSLHVIHQSDLLQAPSATDRVSIYLELLANVSSCFCFARWK